MYRNTQNVMLCHTYIFPLPAHPAGLLPTFPVLRDAMDSSQQGVLEIIVFYMFHAMISLILHSPLYKGIRS